MKNSTENREQISLDLFEALLEQVDEEVLDCVRRLGFAEAGAPGVVVDGQPVPLRDLAHRLPVATLKKIFAGVLILLSAKMLHTVFAG